MAFKHLFYLEDNLVRIPGLYTMWTLLFIANCVCLGIDTNASEAVRNFSLLTNSLSLVYGSVTSINNIYGNKLPSTMLLISAPIHQYGHWLLFSYFGPNNIISLSPVGIMNLITSIITGIFTIDMIIKTWINSIRPEWYREYAKKKCENGYCI